MKTSFLIFLIPATFLLTSCQSVINKAARNTQYSAYELIGIQKRDLLKTRVDDARDEQKEAGEDFQDALERLKSMYGFKGGDLEKKYDSLRSSYERARAQSDDVKRSIQKVEVVAKDLFEEWEKEIDQMETASLKNKSRETLAETRRKYASLHISLKSSEEKMEPVLKKFSDQVLYLKHNLNAKAIASLKGEMINIQGDIEKLIKEMNKSIDSADSFIKEMP